MLAVLKDCNNRQQKTENVWKAVYTFSVDFGKLTDTKMASKVLKEGFLDILIQVFLSTKMAFCI